MDPNRFGRHLSLTHKEVVTVYGLPMTLRTALFVPGCLVLLLAALAAPASADLTVTYDPGTTTDIYARGASSLAAPQNTTIVARWHGYFIDWSAPTAVQGLSVAGYDLYRVPADGTPGDLVVRHLSNRYTAAYDAPGDGTYVYFVTAQFSAPGSPESVPGNPVSTTDAQTNYPHCNVVGIYTNPPFYDSHLACLFPLP